MEHSGATKAVMLLWQKLQILVLTSFSLLYIVYILFQNMLMMFSVTGRVSSNVEAGTIYETSTSFAEKFKSECNV